MSGAVLALQRESDFQAAWYYSLLIFSIVCLIVGGCLVVMRLIGPMWRAGDRGLAMIVGAAAGVTAVFFAFVFAIVAGGLLTRVL